MQTLGRSIWNVCAVVTAGFLQCACGDPGLASDSEESGSNSGALGSPPLLTPIGRYQAEGGFDVGASEIVAYDARSKTLYSVNAALRRIDRVDLSDPARPIGAGFIDITPWGNQANGVAVSSRGVLAAAIESANKQEPGTLAFFDRGGAALSAVQVGALPDMVTFTPDGRTALVANEGEPNADYSVDPEGSVSIVDLRRGASRVTQADVRTADFRAFDAALLDPSIRIFGPGASVSQDLEPEYIAVSEDGRTAWVTLQENNALGVIDIAKAEVKSLVGLGFKDHSLPGNGFDASDRDSATQIAPQPTFGAHMPDAVASYRSRGRSYLVLANEGDAREYGSFVEAKRVKALTLDATAFPNAAVLQADAALGRLNVSSARGDSDGDGDFDALYSFGARSFSIRDAAGGLVFDSGDLLEQITLAALPNDFNSTSTKNGKDDRSDDKGPEPEGIALGRHCGRTYAFVGLERVGGIVVFDVTSPRAPVFVQYVNTRDFSQVPGVGTGGDLAPEGLHFISAEESPTHKPLLAVGYETSGSVAIFEFD